MHRLIFVLFVTILPLAGCVAPLNPLTRLLGPTPMPDPTTQAIIAALQGSSQPATTTYASPDGVWRVDLAVFACTPMEAGDIYAYETVSLAGMDGADAIVDSQLINCGGLGAYGFDGLFWSADSRYFYYTTTRESVADGCGDWQPPIRRVDVTTGASEDVSASDPSPDAAALTAWQEQHQVHCTPAP